MNRNGNLFEIDALAVLKDSNNEREKNIPNSFERKIKKERAHRKTRKIIIINNGTVKF